MTKAGGNCRIRNGSEDQRQIKTEREQIKTAQKKAQKRIKTKYARIHGFLPGQRELDARSPYRLRIPVRIEFFAR